MAIDTASAPQTTASTTVDTRTHARRGALLIAFAIGNLWLWGTRTYNMLTADEVRTAAFIAVHLVLYGASSAFAVAFGVVGWRMRSEARA